MHYPSYPGAPPPAAPPYPDYPGYQGAGAAPSYPPMPMPLAGAARAPQRNVGMIVGGVILLLIGLAAAGLFFWNLHTYLTIEEHFASDPALQGVSAGWVVKLVKAASMKRMTIFGPAMGLFGIGGLVLGGLGLRKR